jgi:aspartyl-tRNA synthetase
MAVMGDFQRVFEIGPVFRAENSHTHRHLCEFTGMDLEMVIKENYHELMDTFANMFAYIFKNLENRF